MRGGTSTLAEFGSSQVIASSVDEIDRPGGRKRALASPGFYGLVGVQDRSGRAERAAAGSAR